MKRSAPSSRRMAGLLLIGDDLTQYLWHRASHTPLLWPLHRAHHSSAYMIRAAALWASSVMFLAVCISASSCSDLIIRQPAVTSVALMNV